MKVDGFRFDLAAIFNRDQDGSWSENSLLLQRINCDPILKEIKLIAEPWDAAAGYNAGRFGGLNWADWNDRFRDDVRRFWRGDIDSIGNFATRFAGSEDLFWSKKSPLKSINFITCHDGFTLNDLVSYRKKHNFANGHLNRDGRNENFSQNFRTEGETDDPKILNQRLRTIKNFLLILFLSQGVPMLSGGDEFLRTQKGNNNPYRQDNEITWYNWNLYLKNHSIFRFCQELIRFRKRHPAFSRSGFFTGFAHSGGVKPDILWFGPKGKIQDWNGANRTLGILINGKKSESGAQNDDDDLYIMFNSHKKELTFVIPPSPQGKKWHLAIDTGAESPADIFTLGGEPELQKLKKLKLKSLSAVVLIAR
jgi:glycogen operon protein